MSAAQPATMLELCRRVAEEASIAGTQAGTVPTTVTGQTGELRRVVNWTRDAWTEVQGLKHYDWMHEIATVTILAGTHLTAQTVPEERYVKDTAYYLDVNGNNFWVDFLPWDYFRLQYSDLDLVQNQPITAWTVRPDMAIVVNGTPLANLALRIERYANPTVLEMDSDEPGMPLDLRMLIVYRALVRYANQDEAGVMRQVNQAEADRLQRDLNVRCLPTMTLGGPLGEEDQ